MFEKPIHLYIATSTWFASAGIGESNRLQGEHAGLTGGNWGSLGKALASHFGTRRKAHLVLAPMHCRFLVTPWVSSNYTHKAIRAQVIDTFARSQGVTEASHHIRIQWPRYGAPVLAVGYPHSLLASLRGCLAGVGLTLADATASVFAIHRKYGPSLPSGHSLLAYAEDDGLTAITLEEGVLAQVEFLPGADVRHGLDGIGIWSSRKRFGFANDQHMRWLASSEMPDVFPGKLLDVKGAEKPVCPAHAVVAACQ